LLPQISTCAEIRQLSLFVLTLSTRYKFVSFRPSVQAALTASTLSLPANADHQIELIGEVIFLLEPDSQKPIYTFSAQIGLLRLSVMTPLSDAAASDAAKRIPKIIADKTLGPKGLTRRSSRARAEEARPLQLICPCLIGLNDLMRMSYPAAVGDTTRTRVRQSLHREDGAGIISDASRRH
jgi:hypothetical protein